MITVDFDPVIFSLGPLQVRWYGLMYVIGFAAATPWLKMLIREKFFSCSVEKIDQLITYTLVGMFSGARTFYVFVYNWDYYSRHLSDIPAVWKGGLSFHGAMLGMLLAWYLFARKNKIEILQLWDSAVIPVTFALFFGRIGNFINGELYGRVTDVPWGMIFPGGGPYPRHPSQLYESLTEGLTIFCILMFMRKRVRYHGYLGATFVVLYGTFRFLVEFFREADSQLGYYFNNTITMGQILCSLMVLFGISIFVMANKKKIINQAYISK